jgi:hypothetical protein
MKKLLISLAVTASIIAIPARATSQTTILTILPTATTTMTIAGYIAEYSAEFGVASSTLNAVIKCESGGDKNAVGDFGTSFGLVQIHLPSHPELTKDQAFDPAFSIRYLAKKISENKGSMWTCYRQFKLSTSIP